MTVWWTIARLQDASEWVAPEKWLGDRERDVLGRLYSKRRRRDWLAGRYVGKRLIRRVLDRTSRSVPDLASIQIVPAPSGAPKLSVAGLEEADDWAFSISHRGQRVACALSLRPGARVGIDCELLEPRSSRFIRDFFTPREQALVDGLAENVMLAANTVWSAKEAVLKALEVGLTVDSRVVSCLPFLGEWVGTWNRVDVRWERGAAPVANLPTVSWKKVGSHVITIAACPPDPVAGDLRVELEEVSLLGGHFDICVS